jgi:hypothetical protein
MKDNGRNNGRSVAYFNSVSIYILSFFNPEKLTIAYYICLKLIVRPSNGKSM